MSFGLKSCPASLEKFMKGENGFNFGSDNVASDLLLKMSKKISQLTKVIYALNTRNGDHEYEVECLKDQHEQEMNRILAETKHKLSRYDEIIGNELQLKRRVNELQAALSEASDGKNHTLAQFDELKMAYTERQKILIDTHRHQLTEMKQQMSEVTGNFEKSVKDFENLSQEFESSKKQAIADQKTLYEARIDELLKKQNNEHANLSQASEKLHEKYLKEVLLLQEEIKTLQADKKSCEEDYNSKIKKMQLFFQNELEAAKTNTNLNDEQKLSLLETQLADAKHNFYEQQSLSRARIEELSTALNDAETRCKKMKDDYVKLDYALKSKVSSENELKEKILTLEVNQVDLQDKIKKHETKMAEAKSRIAKQTAELQTKSDLVTTLQGAIMQHESTISILREEIKTHKLEIAEITKKCKSWESQVQSTTSDQTSALNQLQKTIYDLQAQKSKLEEDFIKQKSDLLEKQAGREKLMKKEHDKAIHEQDASAKRGLEALEKEHDEKLKRLTADFERRLKTDSQTLHKSLEAKQLEFNSYKQDVTEKLKSAHDKISNLSSLLESKSRELEMLNGSIDNIKVQCQESYKSELEMLKGKLNDSITHANRYKAECKRLKGELVNASNQANATLSVKMNELSVELDKKWAETLRKETQRLKCEAADQAADDKQIALEQLMLLKNKEIETIKNNLSKNLEGVEKQAILQAMEDKKLLQIEHDKILQRMKSEHSLLIDDLNTRLRNSEENYKQEVDQLKEKYELDLKLLKEKEGKTRVVWEAKMKEEHEGQMSTLRVEMQSKFDVEFEGLRGMHDVELEDTRKRFDAERELLKMELSRKFSSDAEMAQGKVRQQLMQVERELQEVKERASCMEENLNRKIESYQMEVKQKDDQVQNLQSELQHQRLQLTDTTNQLELKAREVLKIRSDAANKLKMREQELLREHEEALASITQNKDQEYGRKLADFERVQSIMRAKLSEAKSRLEEADKKFEGRPSRVEDVDEIDRLKRDVNSQEKELKRLLEEKKAIQMELVNRETNFNKVFNANPQVGIINPLTAFKKKSGDGKSSQRLAPLPGSPMHDDDLNHTKPLPNKIF